MTERRTEIARTGSGTTFRNARIHRRMAAAIAVTCAAAVLGAGSREQGASADAVQNVSSEAFAALRWRSVGSMVGGRSIAAIGITGRPHRSYFGATGGGLWRTDNGGTTWQPVGDGQFASSSVGAIDACEKNPDVLYIGFGEVQLRGDVVPGDGIYGTTDGGRTWSHFGLASSTGQQSIGRIRVDPGDCNRACTRPSSATRSARTPSGACIGIARWRTHVGHVLNRSDRAGAVDLSLSRKDPKVLYASFWEAYRNEWSLSSGGAGSGLFKSSDGGDTWTELTRNPGLPKELWGKVERVSGPTETASGPTSKRATEGFSSQTTAARRGGW